MMADPSVRPSGRRSVQVPVAGSWAILISPGNQRLSSISASWPHSRRCSSMYTACSSSVPPRMRTVMGASAIRSLLAKGQVKNPAAADVFAAPAAVREDGLVGAARLFEGICQNGHVLESALIVDCPSQCDHRRRPQGGLHHCRTEGVADNIAQQQALLGPLGVVGCLPG